MESPNPNREFKTSKKSEKELALCKNCENVDFPCDSCVSAQLKSEIGSEKTEEIPGNSFLIYADGGDGGRGRHLIAKNDISAGTIIFQEEPMVHAPFEPELMRKNNIGVCTGCYALLPVEHLHSCPKNKCQWQFCSKDCEKAESHRINECRLKVPYSSTSGISEQAVLNLRIALLKQNSPNKYTQLMKLNNSLALKLDPMIQKLKELQLSTEQHYNKLDNVLESEEYVKIFDTVKLNAIGLSVYYDVEEDKRLGWGIYEMAAGLSYSCQPNCGIRIEPPGPTSKHLMTVHAAVNIKKGEPITRYWREKTDMLLCGIHGRQESLQSHYGFAFKCRCPLCRDPTEGGTNMSTLYCKKCKDYTLIPKNPEMQSMIDLNKWEWTCQTSQCNEVVKKSEMDPLNERILKISKKIPMTEKDFNLCSFRWPMLKDQFKDQVHPNYWAIVKSAWELNRQYCQVYQPPIISKDWEYREELLIYLLSIMDVIRPGISMERAQLKYYLGKHWFVELYGRDLKSMNELSDMELNLSKLNKIQKTFEDALEYFDLQGTTSGEKTIEIRKFMDELQHTKGLLLQRADKVREVQTRIQQMFLGGH